MKKILFAGAGLLISLFSVVPVAFADIQPQFQTVHVKPIIGVPAPFTNPILVPPPPIPMVCDGDVVKETHPSIVTMGYFSIQVVHQPIDANWTSLSSSFVDRFHTANVYLVTPQVRYEVNTRSLAQVFHLDCQQINNPKYLEQHIPTNQTFEIKGTTTSYMYNASNDPTGRWIHDYQRLIQREEQNHKLTILSVKPFFV